MYDDLFDDTPRVPRGSSGQAEPSWDWERERYDDLPTDEEEQKPGFFDHVEELRTRAIRSFLALLVAFVGSLFVGRYIIELIESPAQQALKRYAADLVNAEREKLKANQQADRPVALSWRTSRDLMIQALRKEGYELPEPHGPDVEVEIPVELSSLELSLAVLSNPALSTGLKAYHPLEPFLIYIKACLITAVVLVSPYLFYQIWQFAAIWLPRRQRRLIYILLPLSLVLFLSGAGLCFKVVFPNALNFLFMFNRWMHITPDLRITDWISFGTILPLAFGLFFELPLAMLMFDRMGIFDVAFYRKHRKIAVVALWLASGFLVPEIFSQFILGFALYALYELGILLIRYVHHSTPRVESEAELTAV